MYHAQVRSPLMPIRYQNGNYGLYLNDTTLKQISVENLIYIIATFRGSAGLSYKIIDGPNTKGNASTTFNLEDIYVDQKKMDFYSVDSKEPIKSTGSMVSNQDKSHLEINLQAYLDYNKTFGKTLWKDCWDIHKFIINIDY